MERDIENLVIPQHVALILDGNGRWAKKRGLPRTVGHKQGCVTVEQTVEDAARLGIRYLTVYGFSTENWKRPQAEIDAIMNLLREYLKESLADFEKENIRTRFIGDRHPLAPDIQELMARAEASTAQKTGMTLNIAVNYGGQDEILYAVKRLAGDVLNGRLSLDGIDAAQLEDRLYTAGQPDPDLILRPSGEQRLSNFLIWQSAYAEYVFQDILWPDYTPADLDEALREYARRHRRFGGV